MATKTYILEHLGCANCASKIERKIASLPGVSEANIVYATKQLRLTAEDPDGLLPELQMQNAGRGRGKGGFHS